MQRPDDGWQAYDQRVSKLAELLKSCEFEANLVSTEQWATVVALRHDTQPSP